MRAPFDSGSPRRDGEHRCSPYEITYTAASAECGACGRRWTLTREAGRDPVTGRPFRGWEVARVARP
jgi:hypothetical protein